MKEPLAEGNQHTQLWRLIDRVDRPQAIHASTYSSPALTASRMQRSSC